LAQIQKTEGGLEKFAEGYKQFGPQVGISWNSSIRDFSIRVQ
jgi:hypothetical protein